VDMIQFDKDYLEELSKAEDIFSMGWHNDNWNNHWPNDAK